MMLFTNYSWQSLPHQTFTHCSIQQPCKKTSSFLIWSFAKSIFLGMKWMGFWPSLVSQHLSILYCLSVMVTVSDSIPPFASLLQFSESHTF
jgi:hypothetical protein